MNFTVTFSDHLLQRRARRTAQGGQGDDTGPMLLPKATVPHIEPLYTCCHLLLQTLYHRNRFLIQHAICLLSCSAVKSRQAEPSARAHAALAVKDGSRNSLHTAQSTVQEVTHNAPKMSVLACASALVSVKAASVFFLSGSSCSFRVYLLCFFN